MSSATASIFNIAERIFDPLIREKLFKDYEELLKHLMLNYIKKQINLYQKQVNNFEKKHQVSFQDFTRSLKGKASWKEDNEWMDWENAAIFLKKWEKIRDDVLHTCVEQNEQIQS